MILPGYYVAEGRTILLKFEAEKSKALRYAAKQSHIRKSVVAVYTVQGYFVKSFDGRG